MKLYSIDIKIFGTAYIKAETKKEARAIAARLIDQGLEVANAANMGTDASPLISERRYSDPRLPDISVSPAMTIHGLSGRHVELAEESVPDTATNRAKAGGWYQMEGTPAKFDGGKYWSRAREQNDIDNDDEAPEFATAEEACEFDSL